MKSVKGFISIPLIASTFSMYEISFMPPQSVLFRTLQTSHNLKVSDSSHFCILPYLIHAFNAQFRNVFWKRRLLQDYQPAYSRCISINIFVIREVYAEPSLYSSINRFCMYSNAEIFLNVFSTSKRLVLLLLNSVRTFLLASPSLKYLS